MAEEKEERRRPRTERVTVEANEVTGSDNVFHIEGRPDGNIDNTDVHPRVPDICGTVAVTRLLVHGQLVTHGPHSLDVSGELGLGNLEDEDGLVADDDVGD